MDTLLTLLEEELSLDGLLLVSCRLILPCMPLRCEPEGAPVAAAAPPLIRDDVTALELLAEGRIWRYPLRRAWSALRPMGLETEPEGTCSTGGFCSCLACGVLEARDVRGG